MSIIETRVRETETRIQDTARNIMRLQKELAQIGRVFRDVWLADMIPALGVAPGTRAARFENWRGDGRTVDKWYALGSDLWRLYSVNNDSAPTLAAVDPKTTKSAVATTCAVWMDAGNSTPANEINAQALSIARAVVTLSQDAYYLTSEINIKLLSWIQAIPSGGVEDVTGRLKSDWTDALDSLTAFHLCCFGDYTSKSFGYHTGLIKF
jgi:hypothetical protein